MASAVKDAVQEVTKGVKDLVTSDKPKKEKKEKKKAAKDKDSSGPDELATPPEYFDHRIKIFEKLKAEYDAEIAKKPRDDITVTLPDGKTSIRTAWETTPGTIARELSKSLYERTVISEVDGELWDLDRPLERSCSLKFIDFAEEKGKMVFWHSSAHILGEAAEKR
jgi:threonyl-tRNA synthetase